MLVVPALVQERLQSFTTGFRKTSEVDLGKQANTYELV